MEVPFFLGTKHWHVFDLNPSFVHYCTRYALFNGPTGNMVLLALQVYTWPLKYICLVVVYLNVHIKDHMVLVLKVTLFLFIKPSVQIVSYIHPYKETVSEGTFKLVEWKPDSSMIAVLVSK